MKQLIFSLACGLILAACGNTGGGQGVKSLENPVDSMSYALGNFYNKQFDGSGIVLDADAFARAFREAGSETPMLSEEEVQAIGQQVQMTMMMRQGAPFTDEDPLPVSIDTFSYVQAAGLAGYMNEMDVAVNAEAIYQAINDSNDPQAAVLLDDAVIDEQVQNLSTIMNEKQQVKTAEEAKGNIEAGEQFLAENASADGIQVTESGLQYKVLQAGNGAMPTASDYVKVHYTGRLLDGTVFDSSVERGEPTEFGVTQVIQGWIEGLQLMKEGAKYEFWIPQELAYGLQSPPSIPPGSVLNFEVELIEILDGPTPTAPVGQ